MSQRIPLNQNRRVTGTTEILELCKDMLRLEHGIGNDFDMDTAEFTDSVRSSSPTSRRSR